jgi:hypothetical protein
MPDEILWERFAETGRIEDYLTYIDYNKESENDNF